MSVIKAYKCGLNVRKETIFSVGINKLSNVDKTKYLC